MRSRTGAKIDKDERFYLEKEKMKPEARRRARTIVGPEDRSSIGIRRGRAQRPEGVLDGLALWSERGLYATASSIRVGSDYARARSVGLGLD
ncbi:hypothetical protein NL676_014855 [Syzygium grande]|nr:hypothetical protein NL676_014855 [Syzygium grande]